MIFNLGGFVTVLLLQHGYSQLQKQYHELTSEALNLDGKRVIKGLGIFPFKRNTEHELGMSFSQIFILSREQTHSSSPHLHCY